MKALKCFLVLFSFVGIMLVGCSDQTQSPVSPSDQASLQKVATREFSGTNNPTGTITDATWKYPDGKILFYKYVGTTEFVANFPDGGPDILSGPGVVEINGITDLSTMIGHWWIKFTLTPNANADGGTWRSNGHCTSTFSPTAYDPDGPGGAQAQSSQCWNWPQAPFATCNKTSKQITKESKKNKKNKPICRQTNCRQTKRFN